MKVLAHVTLVSEVSSVVNWKRAVEAKCQKEATAACAYWETAISIGGVRGD